MKPRPDRNVLSWLAEADEDRVFVSVISFAEIRREIELMPAGRRRERLAQWLAEELPCDSRTGSLLLIRESPTPGECSTAQRGKVARCSARSTALSPRLPKCMLSRC